MKTLCKKTIVTFFMLFGITLCYSQDYKYYYDENFKLLSSNSLNYFYVREVYKRANNNVEIFVYRKSDRTKQWYFYGTMKDYSCATGMIECNCNGEFKFYDKKGFAYQSGNILNGNLVENMASINDNSVYKNGEFLYEKSDRNDFGENYKEISTVNLSDGKIVLVKKINLRDYRTNPDKTMFYKTTYGIVINNGKDVKINEIETSLYTMKKNDNFMKPCMLFDPNRNVISIFANGKNINRNNYGMDGNVYRIDLTSKSWKKEVIFENANYGFYSFFGGSNNGNPELWHFSYAGYFALKSYRNNNGTWSTDNKGSIRPETASQQHSYKNNILVTSSSGITSFTLNNSTQNTYSSSNRGITANDVAIGSTIILGGLLWEGAKWLFKNNAETSSSFYNSNTNISNYLIISQVNCKVEVLDYNYLGISTNNDEKQVKIGETPTYYSKLTDKYGEVIKEYDNSVGLGKDDGAISDNLISTYISNSRYPITVTVTYKNYKNENVQAIVILEKPAPINIKPIK